MCDAEVEPGVQLKSGPVDWRTPSSCESTSVRCENEIKKWKRTILLLLSPTCGKLFRRSAVMGFFGAYLGFLMGFQWLVAGQERYSRCVDYYKTGSRTDGQYNLEIFPRIVVSVYCKGMVWEKS